MAACRCGLLEAAAGGAALAGEDGADREDQVDIDGINFTPFIREAERRASAAKASGLR